MMRLFIVFITLFFVILPVLPEKWVGQVATYNLIDGTKTADGQVFDPDNLTAACNGFRLGATVIVTNVKTGKQTEVTITDRIKDNSNYFMLLSPKAAKELGLPWETSLAVIDAKFSDVNSTEILPITGLVSEGTVDKEKFKKFPDINWPNDDKAITKMITPKEDTIKIPKEKDEKINPDKQDKINGKTPDEILSPDIDNSLNPEKIMKKFMIDEDIEETPVPKKEISQKPNTKEKNLSTDEEKTILPEKDKTNKPNEKNKNLDNDEATVPKKEIIAKPKEKNNNLDKDETVVPKKETINKPKEKINNLDNDEDVKKVPEKEILKTPPKKKNQIDSEAKTIPEKDKNLKPEIKKDKINPDTDIITDKNISPKQEISKIPLTKETVIDNDKEETIVSDNKLPTKEDIAKPTKEKNKIDEDKNIIEKETKKPLVKETIKPKVEKNKIDEDKNIVEKETKKPLVKETIKPKVEKNKIDEDKNIAKIDKQKDTKDTSEIIWLDALPKGKIYIRFSATYDKDEGERRLLSFKKVFPDVCGLKDKNKYILLVGPIEKKDVDKYIKGIRNFGYKDAYIIGNL